MTGKEINQWQQHVSDLQQHVREYYQYDTGYTYQQKQRFNKQRARAIDHIKHDLLDWPPFAEIAYQVNQSPFCFEECFDSMDWGMEQTIKKIQELSI